MEEHPGSKYENKDIQINIFESLQIDLRPSKPKKRRKVDEYDYDDPFLESFEGEFDVVELECKLENFFVYKGKMEEDPKRIARRYNNSLKKTKLIDALTHTEQKAETSISHALLFEFEKMLASAFNPNSKYKKESKFENVLMWMVFMEEPKSDFECYLKYKLLSLYNSEKYSPELKSIDSDELKTGLENLKNEIEDTFRGFLKVVNDSKNFSNDKRSFNKFKEDTFIELMVEFYIKYMKYYAALTNESLQYIKNCALEYLNAMLPGQCTNKIKLKHYLSKIVHSKIEKCDYDLEKAIIGEFVRLGDTQETNSQHKRPKSASALRSENGLDSRHLGFTTSDPLTTAPSSYLSDGKHIKKQDFATKALLPDFGPKTLRYIHPTKPVFSSTFIKTDLLSNAILNRSSQGSIIEEVSKGTSIGSDLPLSSTGILDSSCSLSSTALNFSKSTDPNTHDDEKSITNLSSLAAPSENNVLRQGAEDSHAPIICSENDELNQKALPPAGTRTKRKYVKKAKPENLNPTSSLAPQDKFDTKTSMGCVSQNSNMQSKAGCVGPKINNIHSQQSGGNQTPIEIALDEQSMDAIPIVKPKRKYIKKADRLSNNNESKVPNSGASGGNSKTKRGL